jgi:hypothetical protein
MGQFERKIRVAASRLFPRSLYKSSLKENCLTVMKGLVSIQFI